MLRELSGKPGNGTSGTKVASTLSSGKLVSDDLVNQLVESRFAASGNQGLILDGYPRTVKQAEILGGIVERFHYRSVVVHLVVDPSRIVTRLSGRRQCPVCGTSYSITTNPPRVAGHCDLDGAVLVAREDDREAVVRERLEQYEQQTRPVLEYFRRVNMPIIETQADRNTPEEIAGVICASLVREQLLPSVGAGGERAVSK